MDPITAFTSQVPFLSAAIVLLRCLSVVPISNLQAGNRNQTYKFNNYKNNFYVALAVLACGNYVVSHVAGSGSFISWIAFVTGIATVAVFELAICAPNTEEYSLVAKKQFSADELPLLIIKFLYNMAYFFAILMEVVETHKEYKEKLNMLEKRHDVHDRRERHNREQIGLTNIKIDR